MSRPGLRRRDCVPQVRARESSFFWYPIPRRIYRPAIDLHRLSISPILACRATIWIEFCLVSRRARFSSQVDQHIFIIAE